MPEPYQASIRELDLDGENPRLPEGHQAQSQDALLETMARDYALIELARSFVDNGYFPEEPLVAVREGDRLKVVEGNRRLAALKLLSDPDLITTLRLGPAWSELAQQWQSQAQMKVPVQIYDTRDEIIPFLGFRHISGVKRWEATEKARFINSLLEGGHHTFAEVGRIVGSPANSVRDSYVAYRILRQAREEFGLDTSRLEDRFGVLLRALSSGPIKEHIALHIGDLTPVQLRQPVAEDHRAELEEVIGWIFGAGDRNPVISDSRKITKLGLVLRESDALEILRATGDFALALAQTEGEEASLLENLRRASYHLDEVKRDVDRHAGSIRVRELVERCARSIESIQKLLGSEELQP